MKENIFYGIKKNDFETGEKIDGTKLKTREEYDFTKLMNCYDKWRKEERNGIPKSYKIAKKLLEKYKILSLSEDYLNEFLKKTEPNQYDYEGIFISAIINELYENEEINLYSNNLDNLDYLGYLNENKRIIIEGDCRDYVGMDMNGGEIVVKGNCRDFVGWDIKDGEIVIEGDCGERAGDFMEGGILRIYGDNFNLKWQISKYAEKGKIYKTIV